MLPSISVARVPQSEIERLRRDVSVERLAAGRGVALVRHGRELRGTCPFHEHESHMLVIVPKTNTWTCPICKGGSVVEWIMRADGISFRHAVEVLRSDHPRTVVPKKRGRQKDVVPKASTIVRVGKIVEPDADDNALLTAVVGYYHETLEKSPEALSYLAARGIRNAEVIEHFRLGLSDRTLGYRLPNKATKAGAEIRGRLERLGICRASGHEHMSGSIVVPVMCTEGRIVGMYGRKITRRLRPGTPLHVYTPEPVRGVFNESGLAHHEVVLTSGIFDALSWWQAGVRHVTTTFGSVVLRDHLREALLRYGVRRVYLAFRRDRTGEERAEKIASELHTHGIEVFRVLFPAAMDGNDVARANPAPEALTALLRQAEWIAKGAVSASAPKAASPTDTVVEENATERHPIPAPPPSMPGEMTFRYGDRTWRARSTARPTTPDAMKVNLFVSREGFGFHVDTLDLYSSRQRTQYVSTAAVEIGIEERIVKKEIGEILLALEQAQEETAHATKAEATTRPKLTAEEEKAALDLLRDPHLLDRVLQHFDRCGVVGERENKLVGYLVAVSRKLHRPLAVVIQASAASGKSSLMEAILDFVPEEDRLSFSALTGQSLFYLGGESDLAHKVLSIAEEEGAARASYALKVLQSEGRLTIANTGKDPTTGRLVSERYTVEGPVAICTTTTSLDIDEELLSRCIVLAVDERPEQTRAIHERQRQTQTLDGLFDREERQAILQLHRNAQRLLAPVAVVNPFASELTFADRRVRARRDHAKYLGLIETLAFLHQHQRPLKTAERGGRSIRYVEVTKEDIAVADRLATVVLCNGDDDLPPTTRHVLDLLDGLVAEAAKSRGIDRSDMRFSRRQVREQLGIGSTQLWVHLRRLVEAEYLVAHPSRHGRGVVYELAHDGTTTNVRGRSGQIRASFGANSGDVRGRANVTIPRQDSPIRDPAPAEGENARHGKADGIASYTSEPG